MLYEAKQASFRRAVKQQIQQRLAYQLDGLTDDIHISDGFLNKRL